MGNLNIIVGSNGELSLAFVCESIFMTELELTFTGEYSNSLDQKNRLSIPAKFRKALHPSNDRTFVITHGFDKCLILYPVIEWAKVESQLVSLNSIKNSHRNFVRSIVRHATHAQYDGQGRVAIPESMCGFANISKQVSVIGMIKKIELWDPDVLKAHESTIDDNVQSFENLASEINF